MNNEAFFSKRVSSMLDPLNTGFTLIDSIALGVIYVHQKSQVHQRVYLEGNLVATTCRIEPEIMSVTALDRYTGG